MIDGKGSCGSHIVEAMVQERYGTRFRYKTLIRKHEELVEVVDAR